MQDGKITFDTPGAVYYPGQNVTGRVEYIFDKVKKVRSIYIKFKGKAHTSWTEREEEITANGVKRYKDVTLTGDEEYFNSTLYLVGNKSEEAREIPPGHHSYNFSFILPAVLPSSYDHEYGYVNYSAKSVLDRPWKFDKKSTAFFKVICHLDLNENPSYRMPVHVQLESTFCCCCCRSGPLCVDVHAPYSGYCPGETIPLEVSVDNSSGVEVHNVKISLRELLTFRVTSPKSDLRKLRVVLKHVETGPGPARGQLDKQLSIAVPQLTPSNLLGCSLIDIDYDLKVECSVAGMHCNADGSKYITIGTVPLREPQSGYSQAAYPVLNSASYPMSSDPYPAPGSAPYSAPSNAPYPVPGKAPYPVPGKAPYPVPGKAPYPVPVNAPYPVPGNAPYPVPGNTPYPVPGNAPYPVPASAPSPMPARPYGLAQESLPFLPPRYSEDLPPPYSEVEPTASPSAPPEESVTDVTKASEKTGWGPAHSTQAHGAGYAGDGQSAAGAESAARSPPYATFPPLPS